ncbi:MAG: DUF2842 domain-containing protein [Sphingopyxis sp.]
MNAPRDDYQPTWRKPAGMLAILAIIALWCFLVVTVMGWLPDLPFAVEMLIYAVAGIVWIVPMGPILQWMETGRFRP